jgi:nicotinamidase-related amidase
MSSGTALLVIDVQVGIIDGMRAYKGADVLGKIADLLSKARAGRVPVLYVQHDGGPGDLLEAGSIGWQIHPAIAPAYGEPVIPKRACDSFFETTLKQELDAREIGRLVIAGCETPYCIDTACRRAVSLGYHVTLVGDAHTTVDSKTLKAEQIIAHHNAVLDGFGAGSHSIAVKPAAEVIFERASVVNDS